MAGDGAREREDERESAVGVPEEPFDPAFLEGLSLGRDVRFVLAVVGGGAARIGRRIAERQLRYVETVAINCDPRVDDLTDFDRRVYLGDEGAKGGTHGSPTVGGRYAQEAEPALERIFRGAHLVCVVSTLGGGTGTGALPYVLEAAARESEILSVFVVKPFACESERRALAERAVGRLRLIDPFAEKCRDGRAWLRILDNEDLARHEPKLGFARLNDRWANVVADHIERSFVLPVEAAVEAFRLERLTATVPVEPPMALNDAVELDIPGPALEPPAVLAPVDAPARTAAPGVAPGAEIELTLEVDESGQGEFGS
jgi:hypothetical protein